MLPINENFTAFMYAKANILIQYKYIGGDF